ncbi:ATP-binding protein [Streptomyces litchfieldiae]|uniref:Tetratricopeptide repeat protein n=1 Tax=Streptomyces litchfieldiae TaxID=3075543 RepID=A0ABU2MS27_9ACTN|nr:AAA family ATPase [Streptomyces sp. DSM 44938]MDT0343703.1 tetratricopeptide repeat protein [Streptomyces sp. DSM 44938]
MRGFQGSEPPARENPGIGRRQGNLPAELTRFIGRHAEVGVLVRKLTGARLVTVTGVGGVGKSRCAIQAARQLQERFCDGVWLVELATVRDPELLDHAVVEALALTDHTGRPPRTVLVERLADRRLLLVLDGFEHLVEPSAELVHELLRRAPGLRVLATGRRPLGVAGERLYPLPPLAAPTPGSGAASALAPLSEAAWLFADRAAAVLPGFSVNEENHEVVAELCHRLDGIPLALELAAGRLRTLSLDQTLHRLDDRFRLLVGGSRGAPPHHQTLRTAIGWSHELCTPAQRLLWARLSVFAGHFDLEAAEYVCSGPDLPADEVLDVLTELVAQSVVTREDGASGVRYRMLDTLRAYGADWLAATGDTDRLRRRHRDWCTGLVTWCELEWFSPRQAEVARRIEDELPNLRAALEFALEDGEDGRLGLYLAGTLWFCWVGCGRLGEGRHWLRRALEQETDHEETRLKALWVSGMVAVLQGDAVAAMTTLHECQEGAERTGNARAAAYSQHHSGLLALISDETQRAEKLLRAALERYEEIGELNSNVLMCRAELAMAIAFQGDLAGAVALCEEVRQVAEEHGERWARTYALYVLGFAAWSRGDTAEARELLEASLPVNYTFRDPVGTVLALELLAGITATEGDPAQAAVLQGAAGRLWKSVGMPLFGSEYFNAPHIQCERHLRRRLGAARFKECTREGERLDTDAAVARALRGRGVGGAPALPAARTAERPALPPAAPRRDDGEPDRSPGGQRA